MVYEPAPVPVSDEPVLPLHQIVENSGPYYATQPLQFHEAVYYTVVSFTTVGYGDIVPHSSAGQAVVVIMLCWSFLQVRSRCRSLGPMIVCAMTRVSVSVQSRYLCLAVVLPSLSQNPRQRSCVLDGPFQSDPHGRVTVRQDFGGQFQVRVRRCEEHGPLPCGARVRLRQGNKVHGEDVVAAVASVVSVMLWYLFRRIDVAACERVSPSQIVALPGHGCALCPVCML